MGWWWDVRRLLHASCRHSVEHSRPLMSFNGEWRKSRQLLSLLTWWLRQRCWGLTEHLLSVCRRHDSWNLCGGREKEGNYTAIDLEQISTDGWYKQNSKGLFRRMSVVWLYFHRCLMSSIRKRPEGWFLSQKNDTGLASRWHPLMGIAYVGRVQCCKAKVPKTRPLCLDRNQTKVATCAIKSDLKVSDTYGADWGEIPLCLAFGQLSKFNSS